MWYGIGCQIRYFYVKTPLGSYHVNVNKDGLFLLFQGWYWP